MSDKIYTMFADQLDAMLAQPGSYPVSMIEAVRNQYKDEPTRGDLAQLLIGIVERLENTSSERNAELLQKGLARLIISPGKQALLLQEIWQETPSTAHGWTDLSFAALNHTIKSIKEGDLPEAEFEITSRDFARNVLEEAAQHLSNAKSGTITVNPAEDAARTQELFRAAANQLLDLSTMFAEREDFDTAFNSAYPVLDYGDYDRGLRWTAGKQLLAQALNQLSSGDAYGAGENALQLLRYYKAGTDLGYAALSFTASCAREAYEKDNKNGAMGLMKRVAELADDRPPMQAAACEFLHSHASDNPDQMASIQLTIIEKSTSLAMRDEAAVKCVDYLKHGVYQSSIVMTGGKLIAMLPDEILLKAEACRVVYAATKEVAKTGTYYIGTLEDIQACAPADLQEAITADLATYRAARAAEEARRARPVRPAASSLTPEQSRQLLARLAAK